MSTDSMRVVHPNVQFGPNAEIGEFVIIGQPARGRKPGDDATILGADAVIRSHTVIYGGNTIGARFQTGHRVYLREANVIGDDVSIGTGTVVEHHVKIGNRVRIHSQAFIPEYSTLEDDCWIGPNVVVTNVFHPLCPKAKECIKGATIGRGAKIGANATLLPDVKIGAMALVGAGAVVISDVPEGAVVVGNPAKVVRHVNDLTCPYHLIDRPYPEIPR